MGGDILDIGQRSVLVTRFGRSSQRQHWPDRSNVVGHSVAIFTRSQHPTARGIAPSMVIYTGEDPPFCKHRGGYRQFVWKNRIWLFKVRRFIESQNKVPVRLRPYRKHFRGFNKHMRRCLECDSDFCSETEVEEEDEAESQTQTRTTWDPYMPHVETPAPLSTQDWQDVPIFGVEPAGDGGPLRLPSASGDRSVDLLCLGLARVTVG